MYFRKKTSGGRAYPQIVESRREGAAVRQQVSATLGRIEDLRESGRLERLWRSGARLAGKAIVLDVRWPRFALGSRRAASFRAASLTAGPGKRLTFRGEQRSQLFWNSPQLWLAAANPSRAGAPFIRLMILVRSPTRPSRAPLGRLPSSSSGVAIATIRR